MAETQQHMTQRRIRISQLFKRKKRTPSIEDAKGFTAVQESENSIGEPFELFEQLEESFDDWLVSYASDPSPKDIVSQPECFGTSGLTYCPAPPFSRDPARVKLVKALESSGLWQQQRPLYSKLQALTEQNGMHGLTVSALLESEQKVFFQMGIGTELKTVALKDSLDAHAALSPETGLVVGNTGLDWRFKFHPLVHGMPFIRCYVGIPVLSRDKRFVLGCIAVMSPFAKQSFPSQFLSDLKAIALQLSLLLDSSNTSSDTLRPQSIPSLVSDCATDSESDEENPKAGAEVSELPANSHGHVPLYGLNPVKRDFSKTRSTSDKLAAQLSRCPTPAEATRHACEVLQLQANAAEVYVIELRLLSTYICSLKQVSFEGGTLVSQVPEPQKVFARPLARNRARSRVVSATTASNNGKIQSMLAPETLLAALSAPFGLRLQLAVPGPKYVLAVPFGRQEPYVDVGLLDGRTAKASTHTRLLEVHSGGFVMVMAGTSQLSVDDTTKLRKVASSLEAAIAKMPDIEPGQDSLLKNQLEAMVN